MRLQHRLYQHQRYDAVTPAAYAMSEHKRHQHLKFICELTLLPLPYQRHPHRRCDADMHLGNDSSTAKPSAAATYCAACQQQHFIYKATETVLARQQPRSCSSFKGNGVYVSSSVNFSVRRAPAIISVVYAPAAAATVSVVISSSTCSSA